MGTFGNILNGELNDRMKPHMKPAEKKQISAEEVLIGRYSFHMSVLKSYVRYLQTVENKSRKEVTVAVAKVVDQLTSKYSFGAKFTQEINKYILDGYQKSSNQVQNEMKLNSKLPEESFCSFSNELKKDKLTDNFSPRFKSIIDAM